MTDELTRLAAPLPRGARRGEHVLVALTEDERDQLRAAARRLSLAPSALARALVLVGLRALDEVEAESEPPAAEEPPSVNLAAEAVERLQRDRARR